MAVNSSPITRHEDDRRVLVEWLNGFGVRSCKVLTAKQECEVGNHYHKNKDEFFYLLAGSGEVELNGLWEIIHAGDTVYVPALTKHSFKLSEGSILLGGATKEYDPDDEYKT